MNKKEITINWEDVVKATGLLANAYQDYISARILLDHWQLLNWCQLANTCIEKYFKAMKVMHWESSPLHHDITAKKIINTIKNKFPNIYKRINIDFIKLLSESYKLRYLDNHDIGFNITISQFKILTELDYTVNILIPNKMLKWWNNIMTRYDVDIKNKNLLLFKNNYILNNLDKNVLIKNKHKIEQHLIDSWWQLLSIEYNSSEVYDDWVFMYDCSEKNKKIPMIYSQS